MTLADLAGARFHHRGAFLYHRRRLWFAVLQKDKIHLNGLVENSFQQTGNARA